MGKAKGTEPLPKYEVGLYNLSLVWKQADFVDRSMGAEYYRNLGERIYKTARRFGCDSRQVAAGVFSALSPNNSEESNMEDLARAVSAFQGSRSELDSRWEKVSVRTYGANKEKARMILLGENPLSVLRGLKTGSFYLNILNPEEGYTVTIDGHMANIWRGKRAKLSLSGISDGEYTTIASGVRELAASRGISANAAQATLWITWRRLHKVFYDPQFKLDLGDD